MNPDRRDPEPPPLEILLVARDAADQLPQILRTLAEALPGAPVVVVDDGSRDATSLVALEGGAQALRIEVAAGRGVALRRGIEASTGQRLLLLDARWPVDLTGLRRLVADGPRPSLRRPLLVPGDRLRALPLRARGDAIDPEIHLRLRFSRRPRRGARPR